MEQSDFGGGPKPKMGQVNWTTHGWVFAIITGDGQLYADSVVIDRGCTLVGVPSDYSCDVKVVTPRHVQLTLKQGTAVRRVGDIELLDKNTTRAHSSRNPRRRAPVYRENNMAERAGVTLKGLACSFLLN